MKSTNNMRKRHVPRLPITVDPEIMSGAAVFTGTRVPVESLFTNLEGGVSLDEYLDAFPDVKREQAQAVLEYAHRSVLKAAA
jgi:uncharacterized protein (DUF433 family)